MVRRSIWSHYQGTGHHPLLCAPHQPLTPRHWAAMHGHSQWLMPYCASSAQGTQYTPIERPCDQSLCPSWPHTVSLLSWVEMLLSHTPMILYPDFHMPTRVMQTSWVFSHTLHFPTQKLSHLLMASGDNRRGPGTVCLSEWDFHTVLCEGSSKTLASNTQRRYTKALPQCIEATTALVQLRY